MTSNLDLIRGRQVVSTLTNKSGGAVIAGDVVIIDTANDESFTTTTTAAYNASQVGIAQESIASNATGRVLLQGYAPLVNVSASATRGYYLLTHTVAKQATSGASFVTGAFGQVLKAGTTPSAYIFPPAIGSSAGITRSGSTTDNHIAAWNGSNADSLKDGGVAVTAGTWTDYGATSTIVGFGSIATKVIRYKQIEKLMCIYYYIEGTSNASNFTFTVPTASAAAGTYIETIVRVQDNGGAFTSGLLVLAANSSTVTLYSSVAAGTWTGGGTKISIGQFFYELA